MTSVIDKVTEDTLALYGHLAIFSDGMERLKYYQAFTELYRRSGFSDVEIGLVSSYSEIADFLALMTFAKEQPEDASDLTDVPKSTPLNTWKVDDWKAAADAIKGMHERLLRQDANSTLEELEKEGEDDQQNFETANEPAFSKCFYNILKFLTFHSYLSPFRKTFEEYADANAGKETQFEPLFVSEKFLKEYRNAVASSKDEKIQNAMNRLLNSDKDAFRSTHDIVRLLNDPNEVFSFAKLLKRTNKLLRAWAETALGEPKMAELYLHGSNAGTKQKLREKEGVMRLQRSRARLNEKVVDPLPRAATIAGKARRNVLPKRTSLDLSDREQNEDGEIESSDDSVEVANQRKESRKRKGSYLEPKESASRVDFDEEENLEDDDNQEDKVALRSPKRMAEEATSPSSGKKQRKSQAKKYDGRRVWTEAETGAIKQGIAEFGWGKWAQIKDHYRVILRNRTSGQIKDKVRNMKNKGELDYYLSQLPEGANERGEDGVAQDDEASE
ncbi:hypothetical protein IV203_031941 [Nitzschia inconspicua]|uniref:Uncharacterized protein n=1 Tax=Nitzschia inconspicua TaxID=303405 RepID=A0A9K3LW93_9STRA|nr:hypothetical protein IV203_031941 [Nitzschia inconspicua]